MDRIEKEGQLKTNKNMENRRSFFQNFIVLLLLMFFINQPGEATELKLQLSVVALGPINEKDFVSLPLIL